MRFTLPERLTSSLYSQRWLFTLLMGLFIVLISQAPVDAMKILFHSTAGLDDFTYSIYMMNANGKNLVKLTKGRASDGYPTWSPDETRIAFTSDRDGDPEIYVMNANGTNPIQLTENLLVIDGDPTWSPEGTQIAFVSDRDGDDDIYVISAKGGSTTNLTRNSKTEWYPSWSPDGTRIAYASSPRGDFFNVFVMNADGTNPTQLTKNPRGTEWYPSWSPDGTRIAFSSDRDGDLEIYVMNADGTNPIRLTKHHAVEDYPSWSPDGTQIAFSSDRDGGDLDIFVMNADGSSPVNITRGQGSHDFAVSWQPLPFAVSPREKLITLWGSIKAHKTR